jgi:hypothetical protein
MGPGVDALITRDGDAGCLLATHRDAALTILAAEFGP